LKSEKLARLINLIKTKKAEKETARMSKQDIHISKRQEPSFDNAASGGKSK
jgi:hypothetical protein